jgi:hypothetical protein
MTVHALSSAATGTSRVTVKGTTGTLVQSLAISLTINERPGEDEGLRYFSQVGL